jgi:pimeloyl-ACP methyl ester carboxylesterase
MSTMTVVLVHGNPETEAIWNPLVDAVGRDDVVRVSPPGFGAPLPDDFPATYLAYRDWLEDELAGFDEPVDVVGHNWGGGHVLNTVMHRPELVRSWASDVVGVFDPDYIWHDLAQVWQTPGDGEQLVDTMMGGTVQGRAERLAAFGIPLDVATSIAAAQGPEMGRAILLLYRSARQPAMAEAGRVLEAAAARPGLSLLATEDHYVGSEAGGRPSGRPHRGARRAGTLVDVPGSGARRSGPNPLLGNARLAGLSLPDARSGLKMARWSPCDAMCLWLFEAVD